MKVIRYRTDEPPALGDYIRSTRRPRFAYFIIGIRAVRGAYRLDVERLRADAVPIGATVRPIVWDSRARKSTRHRRT